MIRRVFVAPDPLAVQCPPCGPICVKSVAGGLCMRSVAAEGVSANAQCTRR